MNNLTIRPRRDLEENWLSCDPILREHEFVISVDMNEIGYKLGDGKTRYSALPFVDLFKAVALGCIYIPQPAQYNTIRIQLLDPTLWKYLKESGYAVIWDKQGNIVIK